MAAILSFLSHAAGKLADSVRFLVLIAGWPEKRSIPGTGTIGHYRA
jgi:hypothetical protein